MTDVEAAHFKEPFLHKSYMVCVGHVKATAETATLWNGLFYRVSDTLNARPGAAAHMSLHLNHYVKERKRPTLRPAPFFIGAAKAP
ncbi:hypothetical protein, partial [Stakelama pacifica]